MKRDTLFRPLKTYGFGNIAAEDAVILPTNLASYYYSTAKTTKCISCYLAQLHIGKLHKSLFQYSET